MQVDQLAGCAVQREGMEDAGMASPRARDGGSEAASRKGGVDLRIAARIDERSEEHTSELQSLMRISYAVFCLKKKHPKNTTLKHNHQHTATRKCHKTSN